MAKDGDEQERGMDLGVKGPGCVALFVIAAVLCLAYWLAVVGMAARANVALLVAGLGMAVFFGKRLLRRSRRGEG